MKLPVKVDAPVARNDLDGSWTKRLRPIHRVEGGDVERRHAARLDHTHLEQSPVPREHNFE
jgi:hypothetical protein